MEDPKGKNKKEGVIPESEISGSDADKAYDNNGDFGTDGNKAIDKANSKSSEEQKGTDADETGNSEV